MNVRSMTGFARVRETILGIEVVLSVKSVNHRGLDIHFYTGSELDPFEALMRSVVKRHVGRGHLDLRAQLLRPETRGSGGVDAARLDSYVTAFRAASEQYGLTGQPDLNIAFAIPGMLGDPGVRELPEEFGPALAALLERALGMLNEFRNREGADIAKLMIDRAASIRRTAEEVRGLRAGVAPAFEARLRERLSELLAPSSIDPQRVVQEAALLADRSDIGEEIERLEIHARQVDEILTGGDEVGKKLDFLLQEMNRETNTILSKTSGLGEAGLKITELAVAVKSDIEKMREQSLNLE
jgi:uncharacterized protein (TIGR00255 family)